MSEEIETEVEEEIEEEEVEQEVEETTEEETTEEEETIDWEARAKKAEALIQKNKGKVKKAKPITKKSSNPDQMERMQLQIDGYPKEIVDNIMELGGKSFLENKIGKQTVDNMVKQHNAEKAADIKTGSQSAFEKKYSNEDLRGKSVEELEKILPKAQEE